MADRRRPALGTARSKPASQDAVLNVSKVASDSSARAHGTGHLWVLVKGRTRAVQLMRSTKLRSIAFELDLQHCPNCGGELKIIATILEQPVEHATRAYEQGRHAPTTGPALLRAHRN